MGIFLILAGIVGMGGLLVFIILFTVIMIKIIQNGNNDSWPY